MKSAFLASATAILLVSGAPALARDDARWSGPYVGAQIGLATPADDGDATVLFDTDLDGTFGDMVTTASGGDAFSPGFCGGTALSATEDPCRDRTGTAWSVHAGYDLQLGRNIVIGVVGEYGQPELRDGVTAFSTTPAFYTLERRIEDLGSFRARAGFAAGDTLIYGTGGLAFATVQHRFTTNNATNTFITSDEQNNTDGYRVGGGVEHRFGPLSIGVLYLFTSIDDEDFRVRATGPNVPVSNPFIRANALGTDLRRSDDRFDWHSVTVTTSLRF